MESLDKKGIAAGTPAQNDYNQLNAMLDPLYKQSAELSAEYRKLREAKDEAGMKKLEARYEELEASRKAVLNKYLEDHPKSPLGIYVLSQVAGYDLDPEKIDPLFGKLSKDVRNTPSGKQFAERLDIAKKVRVGNPAIEFSQNDPEGKPVTLASFRGKYVLIDFWASWCEPCVAEMPSLLRLADLTANERGQLPPLKMSMHMWGQNPAQRFAIIDGSRVGEGDRVGNAVVDEIDADGVVLSWNGLRVKLPVR